MSRINSGYKQFPIRELDGGINLEGSPNEIDNKQCLRCENFNFDGNKLVSGKTYGLIKDTNLNIHALNEIDGDYYILSGGNVYKNNSALTINARSAYIDGDLNVGTTYTVTINGVGYSKTAAGGDTISTVLNHIKTLINNAGFNAEVGFINIDNSDYPSINVFGSITSFTTTNLTRYNSVTITGITDGQILKNGLDLIVIGNGKGYLLQKTVNGNNIGYITQAIPFKEKPLQGMCYGGKLFYITGDSNILYFSKTADAQYNARVKDFGNEAEGELYDAGLQMIGGDGVITGMLNGENGIYIFKKNEVYYSNSVNDDGVGFNFVMRKIASYGAESYKGITSVGQETFYFDGITKKLRRLSYEQNLTTLRDVAVSSKLGDLLSGYSNVKLGYKYPNVYIYSDNKDTIIYNVDRKSFAVYKLGNINRINGRYLSIGDTIFEFDKTHFQEGEFISKEYDFGDAINIKRYSEVEIYGKKGSNITLFVDLYEDGELYQTFEIESNYGDYFRRRFDMWNEGRYFQFGLRYEGAGELEINEFNITFKSLRNFTDYQG